MSDGHLGKCKSCAIEYSKAHRKANPKYYSEYDKGRLSNPDRIIQCREAQSRYKDNNMDKVIARSLLNNAVKRGKIIPEPCFICGDSAEGHHSSYDLPLDVTWLCKQHHSQLHAEFGKEAVNETTH